ncbi:FMN-binding glutamate synthase family protein [Aciduricibacillus chroicocephali]|uniref:FMN-binding glutamate synthase family protein n=1 Tax=Aciduricibacillus chroicocephali TaxID=3054939 RepID=A0ABY9KTM7_9BACI|nr:FMN-binding glutamate synthase family protein [Bacillaceae bacterium 44XB]
MELGLTIVLVVFGIIIIGIPLAVLFRIYFHDRKQEQHTILRNYPVLGKARYIVEKMGPELRQYLFNNDNEGKPFSRRQFEFVYKAAKYNNRMIGYGSERDFEQGGYYLVNSMFPSQREEVRIEQEPKVKTKLYRIEDEGLFSRKEKRHDTELDPFLYPDEDAIILGKDTVRQPFKVKGMIGQSAMSFGSLGDHAVTALSKGLGMAGGTWMNTGEGSLSPYHQKGEVDIIMQISSGLFGVRTEDGKMDWDAFVKKSRIEQVKAFELKLAQGAKQRGGHVDGSKVTKEIAEIRNIKVGQTVDSPNRFHEFSDIEGLLHFVEKMRELGGKPVGTKIVIGDEKQAEQYVAKMKEMNIVPDFITIDGGEGGSGATYYELAESVGLPAFSALPLLDDLLKKYGLRERTHIIASGKLLTPDRAAMALALGADMINIARGFMLSVGCIMAEVCHTNRCPTGVTTTDPKLQQALAIEEKKYRVANYVVAMREGIFELAAVAGLKSPREFSREHIVYKQHFKDVVQHR